MEPNPDIWDLRSVTRRIIKAHRCHLLTLSTIFLLPLSSLYLIYPTLSFQLLNHFYSHQHNQPINLNPFFFYLLYSLFVMFFSFCGLTSITNSVFHAFYDQPFNLVSSIKSIPTSFFPLLATTIVLKLIFFFISLFFVLLFILGTRLLGITITSSPYFLGFSTALVVLPMLFVVIYLQVRWTLVPVIVVLESCWGLEALRRSASLIKGMKKVALTLLLFFGLIEWLFIWSIPVLNLSLMGSPNGIGTFDLVKYILLEIVWKSLFIMLYLFYNTVVNTVLYIVCKEGIHANECGKEYVSLPLGLDDKV